MVAAKCDKVVCTKMMQENQKNVRNMVLESYQDMLDGKGRNYEEFFAAMESRYRDAQL